MADWFAGAAERFKKQESVTQARIARSAQEGHILNEQSPVLWSELVLWLRSQIKQFNEAVGREIFTPSILNAAKCNVFAKSEAGQRDASVEFDRAEHSITCIASDHVTGAHLKTEQWLMRVLADNSMVCITLDGAKVSLETIGENILNTLLGWK